MTSSDASSDTSATAAPRATGPRVVALGLLLHHDHVLLTDAYDATSGEHFSRPIGGSVEVGERAAEAVVREYLEEFGLRVEVIAPLGVVENLFDYEGQPGHEIVFEFVLHFAAGATVEDFQPLTSIEDGRHVARWVPLAEALGGLSSLKPEGLEARLADWVNTL